MNLGLNNSASAYMHVAFSSHSQLELDDQEAYFRFNQLVYSVLLAHNNIPIKRLLYNAELSALKFAHTCVYCV